MKIMNNTMTEITNVNIPSIPLTPEPNLPEGCYPPKDPELSEGTESPKPPVWLKVLEPEDVY